MLRLLSRPLSAVFALWFALVLVDPGVLHACAMHGGAHAAVAATSHAGHHGTAPKGETTNLCSCVGQCCAAAAVAPVPAPVTFSVPSHVAQPVALFAEPGDEAPSSPDFTLPFANGPPQA